MHMSTSICSGKYSFKQLLFVCLSFCLSMVTAFAQNSRPAVDRIVGQVYKYYGMKMGFWSGNATLLFTLLLLDVLAVYHKRKGQSIVLALTVFGSYLAAFLVLELLPKTKAWQQMVEAIV
jgi:hypothetical protein